MAFEFTPRWNPPKPKRTTLRPGDRVSITARYNYSAADKKQLPRLPRLLGTITRIGPSQGREGKDTVIYVTMDSGEKTSFTRDRLRRIKPELA